MSKYFKFVWIFLLFMALFSLLTMLIPIKKYQQGFIKQLQEIQIEPQRRIDATNKYIEAIENGMEDISNGLSIKIPQKYYDSYENYLIKYSKAKIYIDNEDEDLLDVGIITSKKTSTLDTNNHAERNYKQPLYIRDKRNPRILYPYRKK